MASGSEECSGAATIRDVARRAGVSATTVSRSLRGISYVAPETRDRIARAAAELDYAIPGYLPRPQLIGVVARYPSQWFFAESIATIERTLRGTGHDLVLYGVGDEEGRRNFLERIAASSFLDGIIIVATSFDETERAALDRLGVPVGVVGGYAPGLPRVGIDDENAMRMATQHLLGLGHREIGLISFAPGDTVGYDTTWTRRQGYTVAMDDASAPVPSQWIISRESTVRGGVRAAEELLTLSRLPTALVAMSDEMALGALWTLRRAGIVVPDAMSIIGFDDNEMAIGSDLTTIHQPVHEQAERATLGLLARLRGDDGEDEDINLPTRLVVRGSTGPCRG
jgi:LacI family transcriptional regulator, repressor for deo operon, udp, cdd, tsx, nupC, and nupG